MPPSFYQLLSFTAAAAAASATIGAAAEYDLSGSCALRVTCDTAPVAEPVRAGAAGGVWAICSRLTAVNFRECLMLVSDGRRQHECDRQHRNCHQLLE